MPRARDPWLDVVCFNSNEMRRSTALAVLGALLVAPTAAGHGGLVVTRICGASECVRLEAGLELVHHDGPPVSPAESATAGEYYVLEPSNAPPPPAFFVPAAGVVRGRPDPDGFGDPAWFRLPADTDAALRAIVRGVDPFPPPRLTRVVIRGEPVADPEAYLALLGELPPGEAGANAEGVDIVLHARGQPSPWTDGFNRLSYLANRKELNRDGSVVRLPPDLVALVERPREHARGGEAYGIGDVIAPLAIFGTVLALWLIGRRSRHAPA